MIDAISFFIQTFGVIFALIDPFGFVPIFIALTTGVTAKRQKKMLKTACLTAFFVLTAFSLAGSYILKFFGLSLWALEVSGGIVLLLVGLEMLKLSPVAEKLTENEQEAGAEKEDISIVPLAFPMLSGPASIAAVTILANKNPEPKGYAAILISVGITPLITYFILVSAKRVFDYVGAIGLNVMTRIMGFILVAIAVQFILVGVVEAFKTPQKSLFSLSLLKSLNLFC